MDVSSNNSRERSIYKDKFADNVFSCQKNLKVLTSTSLVSSAILMTDYQNTGGVFSKLLFYSIIDDILSNVSSSIKLSNDLKFYLSNPSSDNLELLANKGIAFLNCGRKLPSLIDFGATSYLVRNRQLIDYYANQAENIINKN